MARRAAEHLSRLGPFIGPFEVLAVAATWVLVGLVRGRRPTFALTLAAAICLSLALVAFFTLNAPVNAAFAQSTPQTLPAGPPIACAGRSAMPRASGSS